MCIIPCTCTPPSSLTTQPESYQPSFLELVILELPFLSLQAHVLLAVPYQQLRSCRFSTTGAKSQLTAAGDVLKETEETKMQRSEAQ